MSYPTTWQPGEILGRNYVPRSNWLDAGTTTTDIAPWTSGTLATRDVANGLGTINRLSSFTATRVTLQGLPSLAAGTPFTVRILAYVADAAATVRMGLVATGSNDTAPVAGADYTLPASSGYVWYEFPLSIPNKVWKDSLGRNLADYAGVNSMDLLITSTSATAMGFAMIRLDDPGSPISGRLDGGLPDDSRFSYEYLGTANRSQSTATALTQYPVPVETPGQAPVPSFTATFADRVVTLDASATVDPEGDSITYAWDFGDGETATGVTTAHEYAADGTYVISLVVTDTTGAVGHMTKTAIVSTVAPPEPEAPSLPISDLAADVVTFMGREGDAGLEALAAVHVPVMAELVNAYVRGNGPTRNGLGLGEFSFPADLRAVVVTASARLLANPAQLESESADGYAARGSFSSFSLAEQAVLHRYRRRVA